MLGECPGSLNSTEMEATTKKESGAQEEPAMTALSPPVNQERPAVEMDSSNNGITGSNARSERINRNNNEGEKLDSETLGSLRAAAAVMAASSENPAKQTSPSASLPLPPQSTPPFTSAFSKVALGIPDFGSDVTQRNHPIYSSSIATLLTASNSINALSGLPPFALPPVPYYPHPSASLPLPVLPTSASTPTPPSSSISSSTPAYQVPPMAYYPPPYAHWPPQAFMGPPPVHAYPAINGPPPPPPGAFHPMPGPYYPVSGGGGDNPNIQFNIHFGVNSHNLYGTGHPLAAAHNIPYQMGSFPYPPPYSPAFHSLEPVKIGLPEPQDDQKPHKHQNHSEKRSLEKLPAKLPVPPNLSSPSFSSPSSAPTTTKSNASNSNTGKTSATPKNHIPVKKERNKTVSSSNSSSNNNKSTTNGNIDKTENSVVSTQSGLPLILACTHEGCGKRFARREHLKRHLRIHTGEMPYTCHICQRKFNRSDNLRQHFEVHKKQNLKKSLKKTQEAAKLKVKPDRGSSNTSSTSSSSRDRSNNNDNVKLRDNNDYSNHNNNDSEDPWVFVQESAQKKQANQGPANEMGGTELNNDHAVTKSKRGRKRKNPPVSQATEAKAAKAEEQGEEELDKPDRSQQREDEEEYENENESDMDDEEYEPSDPGSATDDVLSEEEEQEEGEEEEQSKKGGSIQKLLN